MMPESDAEVVVVAVFRRDDLVRLHSLLACYESPFTTNGERGVQEADVLAMDSLRRYLRALLDT
jgi:hypothetical protein